MGARQTLLALLLVCVAATGAAAAAAGAEEAMAVRAAADAGKVQAGSTLCCTNMTAYHECVVACFDYYPREQAEKICDTGCQEAYQCRATTGDECPGAHHPSSDHLTDSVVGEVQAVTTTLCCSNMTGFHECVHDCFGYFPREQAEKICDPGCKEAYQCRSVSGDKCPSEHRSSSSVVGEAQAVTMTLCCSNMTGFHDCVHDCFGYFPREQAEKICDPGCKEAYQCRAVSGDKCPSEHRSSISVVGEAQAVTTTLCCSNMTGFHECVHDCFGYFPREQAEKICDPGCKEAYQCQTVSGDKCPSGHRSSSSVTGVAQAVTTTLCCSNMTGFHECVHDCFGYFPREQAEKICDPGCKEAYQCQTVSGDKCPGGHRSSNLITNSAKGDDAVEKCVSGCNSSVCSKMVTGVGSKRVAVKRAIERCNNACYKFCSKGLRAGTATA